MDNKRKYDKHSIFNYHACGCEGAFYDKLENVEKTFFSIPSF